MSSIKHQLGGMLRKTELKVLYDNEASSMYKDRLTYKDVAKVAVDKVRVARVAHCPNDTPPPGLGL